MPVVRRELNSPGFVYVDIDGEPNVQLTTLTRTGVTIYPVEPQ